MASRFATLTRRITSWDIMKFIKKHTLLTLFILGLLLRLSLIFIDFSWDVNNHIAWAKDLHNRGFRGFYEMQSSEVYATLYPNYPPLSLFIFYLIYALQSFVDSIAWWLNLTIPLFPSKLIFFLKERSFLAGIMKLPGIFSDLGIAWVCFLFAKKIITSNQLASKLVTTFVLFNPAFFFNSALWGQIDSIPIFFVLLSIYFLLFTKRFIFSGIFFVLALLVKPTALVFLPLYFIFFIRKYSLANFLKTFLVGNFIFFVSFFPFLKNLNNLLLPYSIYSEKILAAQSLPFVTNGAFNFWVLIRGFDGIKDTAPFLFGISYRLWGYLTTGFFTLFILIRSGQRFRVFYSLFLLAFVSFLFLTKMHERYSMLPLPFLLLAGLKNKKIFRLFVILSLISFLNLYHSWPVPKIEILFTVISNPLVVVVISLLNIILFFYLFKKHLSFRTRLYEN